VSCAICETRKEKRFCLAVHGRICAQCCGQEREVSLDCPSDCVYLQQARQHEKGRSLEDLEGAELFRKVDVGEDFIYEHEHLFVGLSYALAKCLQADRNLNDRELIAALTALTKKYETLVNSGLHYETQSVGMGQQAVSEEIEKMLAEHREVEEKELGYSRLRDSVVLRCLVFLVRLANARTSGRPKSRAFADFVSSQFPAQKSGLAEANQTAGQIIRP
jgi:hypothetical protein